MDIRQLYDIEIIDDIFMATLMHVPTVETIRLLVDYQIKSDKYKYRLFDINGFSHNNVSVSDLRQMADFNKAYPSYSYAAVITNDMIAYGIAKLLVTCHDKSINDTNIFMSRDAGIRWLKEQQAKNI